MRRAGVIHHSRNHRRTPSIIVARKRLLAKKLPLATARCEVDRAQVKRDLQGTLPTTPGAVGERWWYLPRAPGRYTVVEGHFDGDGEEARWCRITPHGKKTYHRRPPNPTVDPVQAVLERISFSDPIAEARTLEYAVELIELGRPELALELCAKASEGRRVVAAWTRILALAALKDLAAEREAIALADAWLTPADSVLAANQVLPRAQLLRAMDAAAVVVEKSMALAAVRAKVAAAPEPDVFVAGGGDFF
jgi:hypothetical protein